MGNLRGKLRVTTLTIFNMGLINMGDGISLLKTNTYTLFIFRL